MKALKTALLVALVFGLALGFALAVACGDDDDDDDSDDDTDDGSNDDADDDDSDVNDDINDDGNDDSVNDDTDDDLNDDADDDYDNDCAEDLCDLVINELYFECQLTLNNIYGDQLDDFGLHEWCELCKEFTCGAKTISYFWSCIGDAAFYNCDQDGIDACLDSPALGGCSAQVNEVYSCSLAFIFDDTDYLIPEMDLAAICDILDWPWDCYQACADAHCPDDTDNAITCMDSCTPPGGILRKMPDSAGLPSESYDGRSP